MNDLELLTRLSELSKVHAVTEVDMVGYLAEVDRRRLHLKEAYRSLFEFIRAYLKCSDATAGRRAAVVRVSVAHPGRRFCRSIM